MSPAAGLFTGGLRKQETRDCKGIKISLGMSLQRGPLTLTRGFLGSETGPRDLSAEFVFHCPGFQHDGLSPAMDFLHVPPLPLEHC